MAEKNESGPNPVLQFSSAAGTPETKRKMMLYRQLLKQELSRDNIRPRRNATVRYRRRQQQQQQQQQHDSMQTYS
ncbi:uncharacterized protein LOC117782219 isoform X2 [Drosophila innubila]|uniref:uncharacterized protein LOC117782219 isoform X2 n=1 Tax=Drosophila innubila TaxID=198719 RepID=UPI00148DFD60|nr:uncharacterized protein LOC117782219 isoform X2 [Drosophila innubila]